MTAAAMPIIFNLFLIVGALAIPLATGWLVVEQAMPLAVALLATGVVQLAVMAVVLVRSRSMPEYVCRDLGHPFGPCGGSSRLHRPEPSFCRSN